MIGAGTLRPASFHRHLIVACHKRSLAKKTLLVSLSLTAMVDMFAVLVIFLLQSFSASPELVVTKGIKLPHASSSSEIREAPFLALAEGELFLNQEPLGSVQDVLRGPEKLMHALKAEREQWQKEYPDKDFPGEIHLQADRSIPSTVIGKIMGTISQAHYHSIQLAVLAQERGSVPVP